MSTILNLGLTPVEFGGSDVIERLLREAQRCGYQIPIADFWSRNWMIDRFKRISEEGGIDHLTPRREMCDLLAVRPDGGHLPEGLRHATLFHLLGVMVRTEPIPPEILPSGQPIVAGGTSYDLGGFTAWNAGCPALYPGERRLVGCEYKNWHGMLGLAWFFMLR